MPKALHGPNYGQSVAGPPCAAHMAAAARTPSGKEDAGKSQAADGGRLEFMLPLGFRALGLGFRV